MTGPPLTFAVVVVVKDRSDYPSYVGFGPYDTVDAAADAMVDAQNLVEFGFGGPNPDDAYIADTLIVSLGSPGALALFAPLPKEDA